MTRRATLDALEPAIAAVSRALVKLGLKPGDMLRVTTRRARLNWPRVRMPAIPRRDLHPVRYM
jgi:hypothetical protein